MCFDTADVYVAMEKDTEASACVQEAHLIFPFSLDVLFQSNFHWKKGSGKSKTASRRMERETE